MDPTGKRARGKKSGREKKRAGKEEGHITRVTSPDRNKEGKREK